MRLTKGADWLEETVEETWVYHAFPNEHWHRIRTNSPLERIMREIGGEPASSEPSPTAKRPSTRPWPG